MKIQILTDIKDCIDGYNPVLLEHNSINIDMPLNSASSILMIGSLENIKYDMHKKLLDGVIKYLRLDGSITISGVDVNLLSLDVINKAIDCQTYNEIISSRFSIYDVSELSNTMKSFGLTIDKITFKGAVYELHATRTRG